MQETAASPSVHSDFGDMNVEEETPQVNLKNVFTSDKKSKDGHKTKSKLRGRVQIKKSELEAEAAA